MASSEAATTAGESGPFDLELIKQEDLTEEETAILKVFAHGIQPASPEAAGEAAHQFDISCPPLEQDEEANHYLWTVWRIMITIARSPDVRSEVHIRLVNILEILQQSAKGNLNVYGVSFSTSFPMIVICSNFLKLVDRTTCMERLSSAFDLYGVIF